jgi:lipopolysaccharide export system permease protein
MTIFLVVGVIIGMIFMFDIIELIHRTNHRTDIKFLTILEMALFKLPQIVQVILPFAVMIGTIMLFWKMNRNNELIIIRTIGVSVWEILTPIIITVITIGIINITAFNPLATKFYKFYEKLQDQLQLHNIKTGAFFDKNGIWLRENHDYEQVVIHINDVCKEDLNKVDGSLNLKEISVYVLDPNGNFKYDIEAKSGSLDNGIFHLTNVCFLKPGSAVEKIHTYDLTTKLTFKNIHNIFSSLDTISLWEFPGIINFFENSGFSAHRQNIYFQNLLSSPLLLIGMALFASVFSLKPDLGSGGLFIRLITCIIFGLIFYLLSKLVYALGESTIIPVVMVAWFPAVIINLISLSFLFHFEDG